VPIAATPKLRFLSACTLLAAAAACTASATGGAVAPLGENPCEGPEAKTLLCPNLRIGPPHDLYVQRTDGQVLLRATSDVRSRGKGPMELRGARNGWHSMSTRQRIYRAGGGYIDVPTLATLHFTDVGSYFGGSYWKVHQLARFELWSVDGQHRLLHRVRLGPKLNYCLRDLERTRPGHRSPGARHYPGCNQNPYEDRVTLGTSVGWSDIYPADYDKQWISVGGLRGCFAFVMKVDPNSLLFESNENDNSSRRLVHLPFRGNNSC
jgi:Lysyl oxidase